MIKFMLSPRKGCCCCASSSCRWRLWLLWVWWVTKRRLQELDILPTFLLCHFKTGYVLVIITIYSVFSNHLSKSQWFECHISFPNTFRSLHSIFFKLFFQEILISLTPFHEIFKLWAWISYCTNSHWSYRFIIDCIILYYYKCSSFRVIHARVGKFFCENRVFRINLTWFLPFF